MLMVSPTGIAVESPGNVRNSTWRRFGDGLRGRCGGFPEAFRV